MKTIRFCSNGLTLRFFASPDAPVKYAVAGLIRERGMVAGLWLEIEVIGIHCPLAKTLPDDWFFQREGHRIIDHGRYQLEVYR